MMPFLTRPFVWNWCQLFLGFFRFLSADLGAIQDKLEYRSRVTGSCCGITRWRVDCKLILANRLAFQYSKSVQHPVRAGFLRAIQCTQLAETNWVITP